MVIPYGRWAGHSGYTVKDIRREKEITWHLVFPRNDVVVVAKDRLLLSMRTTPLIAKTNQKPHLKPHLNEALNA